MKSVGIVVLLRAEGGRGGRAFAALDPASGRVVLEDVHWAGAGDPPASWDLALVGCSFYVTREDWDTLEQSGDLTAIIMNMAHRQDWSPETVAMQA